MMSNKVKKHIPYMMPLVMLLLGLVLLLGVTILRRNGINRERKSVVLINGHTEDSNVQVSFLRNPEKQRGAPEVFPHAG